MYWLAQHPEVQILKFEIKSLQKNHPAHIIKRMFTLPEGPYLRGYKSPNDVEDHRALNKLNEHYPKTKLFVGIRHPVRWFESFYNYRVQNGLEMPPADKLPIRGALENRGVSIDRANFHKALVHFGKTNLNDKERNLFSYSRLVKTDVSGIVPAYLTNKVFLYDTDQLGDKNETRVESFRFDVANYLGLNETMPPVLQVSPGQKNLNITEQALRDSKKIRICDDQYREVRKKLLLVGGKVGEYSYFERWFACL